MRLFGRDWTFKKSANHKNFLEMDLNEEETENAIYVYSYAIYVITDLIASIVSNIEFKTYANNSEEKKGHTWVKLNVHPNINQNSTEFIKELTKKLLLGEVLIVQVADQLIIADDYTVEEKAVKGNVFTNVRRGEYTFRDKFKAEDVVYLKYQNKAIKEIIANVVSMYENLLKVASDKYARSGEEKGILTIDQAERNRKDFDEIMEQVVNKRFKNFYARGNHVLPLFSGYKYESNTSESTKKYSNEITDIKTLFEEALSRVAQAYKVPVGLVRGDVAGIKEAYTMLLTNCIDPIAHAISEEFTYKFFSEEKIIDGYAIEADTTCIKHVDIFDLAASIDKLIASGFLSIDEVRLKSGLRELDTEWSRRHFMTLNYTAIENTLDNTNGEQENSEEEGSEET